MINPWQKIFSDHNVVVWSCNKRPTSKRERYKEAIDLIIEKKRREISTNKCTTMKLSCKWWISVNDV